MKIGNPPLPPLAAGPRGPLAQRAKGGVGGFEIYFSNNNKLFSIIRYHWGHPLVTYFQQ